MPSNINPSLEPTKSLVNFRFWCQKVLPLVYDDSLSYYEVLGKMVVQLNDVIDNVNADTENVLTLKDAFLELQTYVNNFFDDIDQLASYAERAEAAQTAANKSAVNAASSASNASSSSLAAMDARDTAVAARQAAQTSANNASTAATNANNKANEAAQSAITAQTAQASASESAALAATDRSAAQTAASTATTKANEASKSASNAETSAENSAQSEANAEELVNNIRENLDNIQQNTQDISELKESINNTYPSVFYPLKDLPKSFSTSGWKISHGNRITQLKETIAPGEMALVITGAGNQRQYLQIPTEYRTIFLRAGKYKIEITAIQSFTRSADWSLQFGYQGLNTPFVNFYPLPGDVKAGTKYSAILTIDVDDYFGFAIYRPNLTGFVDIVFNIVALDSSELSALALSLSN